MPPSPHAQTRLHTGSPVVCQFTIEGTKHRMPGLVKGEVQGDPDKLRVDFFCPVSDQDNLLQSPVTFGRVLQHGDKGEHATFRYVGEDD